MSVSGFHAHVRAVTAMSPLQFQKQLQPKRIVVTEFPSIEQARRGYDSEEYRALKALRLRTARGSVVLVEAI